MTSSPKSRARAERAVSAADARLPALDSGRELLRKAFPDHWSFLLGEIALYSFVVLLLTGTFLAFFFHPDMAHRPYAGPYAPLRGTLVSEAYASTMRISFEVRGGLLIRQIHHWGALIFVASLGCHLLRVFLTGAFRRPREVNWVIGVTMFGLALLEGYCGYSLPDDLLSGMGVRIAEGIMLSLPVVGSYLAFLVFGGEFPGEEIVSRFYLAHVLLLPGLLVALITAHLLLVVYLKHTQWPGPGRTNRNVVGKPLWPAYAAKSLGLFFAVFGVLAVLAATVQINPVWEYGPYRPDLASLDAQPDWYVGFLEGALRLMPGFETDLAGHTLAWTTFLTGVVLPVALFAVLYAYPFFERRLTGDSQERHLCERPRNHPTRTALGAGGVAGYAVLLLAGGQDVLAHVFHTSLEGLVWVFRVAFFVVPVLAYLATKRLCLGLQATDRRRLAEGEGSGEAVRTAAGGYAEERLPLPAEAAYALLVRDVPVPTGRTPAAAGHHRRGLLRRRPLRLRVRDALSAWYFGQRVDLPADEERRRRIEEILAPPTHPAPPRARVLPPRSPGRQVWHAVRWLLRGRGR
ncbi:cytochrome b [Streptomyces hoynatensis]|uniref:Cytochrome bc1 complex cytochrome b subunit n=1 Tax=Streptomyces hoynatensis TaxID=1141874 RepID=A0A3A9YT97_9ACTN|nr:ubiquinol-cytochrome c reductase cytochrome b subunit [Streptomyces hoynatensis]RKN39009.1 ubiquinol-cytochrome c reductase cytochrome b subunit [Streptomyces hoynatensis]